jgi:spore maturation protein CgeB
MKRRILYVGGLRSGQTSFYRFRALKRLQQDLIPFDLAKYSYKWNKLNALTWRFPVGPLIAGVNADLITAVRGEKPDIVWFDKPIQFTPATIRTVKELGAQTVCFNQDNPFGPREDGGWYQFYKIYRMLDLHCLFRNADIPRYREWGLSFIKIQLSFDPEEHFPPPSGWSDADRTREVSYTGSPYEYRPQFLRSLIENFKLPVSISGPRWDRVLSKDERIRYKCGGMLRDAEYRENIWKSKINLAFITHLNEEDVVHKSFEIAACRGFLLTERSPGHQECFQEGKEAEFFSSIEECADKIRYYLDHPAEREKIAASGCERAKRSGYDNDTQLSRVLSRVEDIELLRGQVQHSAIETI